MNFGTYIELIKPNEYLLKKEPYSKSKNSFDFIKDPTIKKLKTPSQLFDKKHEIRSIMKSLRPGLCKQENQFKPQKSSYSSNFKKKFDKKIELKLWKLIIEGGPFIYIKVLNDFIYKYFIKSNNFFNSNWSNIKYKYSNHLLKKRECLDSEFESKKKEEIIVLDQSTIKNEMESLNLNKQEPFSVLQAPKMGLIRQNEENELREKISGMIQNKKFQEVIFRVLEAIKGERPEKCFFEEMSDSQQILYWILMEKYLLLPDDWARELESSFAFPNSGYDPANIKFPKRVKGFLKKKYIFLFLFITLKQLNKNEKSVDELFEFFSFESSFKLNKKRKVAIIKYLKSFWEHFSENSIKELSLEFIIKFKTTKSQFNIIHSICKNLTERRGIFANLKELFVNAENKIQEYRIQEIIKMMIPFVTKADELVSKNGILARNLKLPDSFKKCFRKYQLIESKTVIVENLALLEEYLAFSD